MFQLKWNKNTVPGKPLKRKLPGTDEEEKREKNKRYEEHRSERKPNTKWQEGRKRLYTSKENYTGQPSTMKYLKNNDFLSVW
jgi:hypothetical protein